MLHPSSILISGNSCSAAAAAAAASAAVPPPPPAAAPLSCSEPEFVSLPQPDYLRSPFLGRINLQSTTMEKAYIGEQSKSANIFVLTGEPAIVINGVPDLTPSCKSPVIMDGITVPEAGGDPGFGEWLEGRKVENLFGDQLYSGKVVSYDNKTKWYRVVYENGDLEDLEWHELKKVLLPLDFSVPLVALALKRCKSMQSYFEYSQQIEKTNKSHGKRLENI